MKTSYTPRNAEEDVPAPGWSVGSQKMKRTQCAKAKRTGNAHTSRVLHRAVKPCVDWQAMMGGGHICDVGMGAMLDS